MTLEDQSPENNIDAGIDLTVPKEAEIVAGVILNRASKRCFSPRKIDSEILTSIVDKARWSPSAHNSQPWRIIITSPMALKDSLYRGNEWALKASHIVAIVSRPEDDAIVN